MVQGSRIEFRLRLSKCRELREENKFDMQNKIAKVFNSLFENWEVHGLVCGQEKCQFFGEKMSLEMAENLSLTKD